ncbi:MAG: hypothetical protein ABI083_01335 [Lapillicoccus sp.]
MSPDRPDRPDRLEQALQDDARRWRDGFEPPSLNTFVARLDIDSSALVAVSARPDAGVTRRRRWWPLAVAAAVLLVVGGVLSVARRHDGPALPSGSGSRVELPQTWTYRGQALTLLRHDMALSAQVTDRSSTTLSVMVRGDARIGVGTACHPLAVPIIVSSDARRIVLAVGLYAAPGPSLSLGDEVRCEGQESSRAWSPVTLDAPLGNREVTDAESGSPTVVGETSAIPTLAAVPQGFLPGDVQTVPRGSTCDPAAPEICASRSWRLGDEVLTLQADPELHILTAPVLRGALVLTGTVRGRPATVLRYPGTVPDSLMVQWREASGQLWRLQLGLDASGATTPSALPTHRVSLTAQELLAAAESFTPPR